jgi:hypothetical protein
MTIYMVPFLPASPASLAGLGDSAVLAAAAGWQTLPQAAVLLASLMVRLDIQNSCAVVAAGPSLACACFLGPPKGLVTLYSTAADRSNPCRAPNLIARS